VLATALFTDIVDATRPLGQRVVQVRFLVRFRDLTVRDGTGRAGDERA
jgi:hypothetical protein